MRELLAVHDASPKRMPALQEEVYLSRRDPQRQLADRRRRLKNSVAVS